jgi:hypothetical protein
MIVVEWEVLSKEKECRSFYSWVSAWAYFRSLFNRWSEIVPSIKYIINDDAIFIMYQDGYISLKLNHNEKALT